MLKAFSFGWVKSSSSLPVAPIGPLFCFFRGSRLKRKHIESHTFISEKQPQKKPKENDCKQNLLRHICIWLGGWPGEMWSDARMLKYSIFVLPTNAYVRVVRDKEKGTQNQLFRRSFTRITVRIVPLFAWNVLAKHSNRDVYWRKQYFINVLLCTISRL